MDRVGDTQAFKDREKTIVLEGFDPVSVHGFTQVPNVVLKDKKLSAGAKLTYAILLSYAWQKDGCFPGQETLASDLGIKTDRQVRNLINELKKAEYLTVKRRGLGKTNVYTLKARVKRHNLA